MAGIGGVHERGSAVFVNSGVLGPGGQKDAHNLGMEFTGGEHEYRSARYVGSGWIGPRSQKDAHNLGMAVLSMTGGVHERG
jgi:hypothetical protein